MALNAALTYILPFQFKMGVSGIALAFSVASIANLLLLLYFLHKKIGAFDRDHKIFESLTRLIFASTVLGLSAHYLLYFFDIFVNTHTVIGLGLQTLGTLGVSTVIYLGLTYLLKCEEITYLISKYQKTT